ncbi:4320_t:CDS:2 [Paraglomus brasilianum]|uniref:4320_t:CDS:1 n=1 Tax=Paraglomus brasilianum TaxID=144538 RepID=A0A9N8ZWW4_9GLOM|nr:4320_t:CDS:2 [Paraglomus brasilianum]
MAGFLPARSINDKLRKITVGIWLQQQQRQEARKPLVVCRLSSKISDVLRLCDEHDIVSLPVFHEELNKFVAIVNLFHVMKYLMLKQVYADLSSQDNPEYDKKARSNVINTFKDTVSDIIDSWGAYAFTVHLTNDPLLGAIQELILKPNTYAILADASHPGEKAGSDVQRASILTQHDVITYLLNHPELNENIQDVPAKNVMQKSWKTFTKKDDPNQPLYRPVSHARTSFVLSISHLVSAITGFKCMAIHGVSSMAVVEKQEDNIKLLDNLSASDIRHLNEDTVVDALLPVLDYLKKVRKTERRPVVCYEETPLAEVMELAVKNSVHRVWVIEEASERPVGEISMTDMLAMYAGVNRE